MSEEKKKKSGLVKAAVVGLILLAGGVFVVWYFDVVPDALKARIEKFTTKTTPAQETATTGDTPVAATPEPSLKGESSGETSADETKSRNSFIEFLVRARNYYTTPNKEPSFFVEGWGHVEFLLFWPFLVLLVWGIRRFCKTL